MKKFIVRRVLLGAMILFFVSMIIYSIERALPTSYVEGRARDMSMKPVSYTHLTLPTN